MILPRLLQQVVREDLTDDDLRWIEDAEPRNGRLMLWYSHARRNPGFVAAIPGDAPWSRLAEVRGHRTAIDAVRAVAQALAQPYDAPEGPTDRFERSPRREFDGYRA